jgi:hypothetical protein
MRRPRYLDFVCPSCSHQLNRLVETNDDDTPLNAELCDNPELFPADEAQPPGYCRAGLEHRDTMGIGYMKTITKGNSDFNERERERLEKRADDHWKREGRHEAIEVEKSLFKKHGMEGLGGVR